uniref:DUF1640 domain-containing protein n=1 Tax=Candidatus Kentrum sp. FW TaxID=2126338 RepID=A0A450S6J2_9GAMM|nr:MAG: hypothetical protein BECKFW1821A_GA0114235_101641 [Candidatus Kentron sp. FW]VFJ67949.1 MAG: hypothetical protein BECKFW1821B_GA0114236_113710 [Candidatus Kentron sp. FW]
MSAIAFDTLKFTKRLVQAGASQELAEATAEAFKEASGEAEVATKSDLREMDQNMKAEFTRMDGEMKLIKWMLTLLLAGVMSLVFKSFFS